MNKFALAVIAGLPLLAASQVANAQRNGDKIADQYICVFKKNTVSRSEAPKLSERIVRDNGGQVDRVYSTALRGFAARMSRQAMENAKARNPNIAYCEQDQVVKISQFQSNARTRRKPGGGGTQPAQETPWGIARVNGGVAGTYATAWIIDTGIDLDHPDLKVDAGRSVSFIRRGTPDDQNGHGTHVAGTIAALDNGIGVIGVTPGATVVAVRVLDRSGSGSNSGVISGIDYVAANGRSGDVANMSLGGSVSQALDDAVVAAAAGGVRFALAAGNESDNANNHSPARANGPNVYTVSAFSAGDNWASFSNYGTPPVDFAEPGVAIKSTWMGGGYNTISGTSMATPHLAGLLLLGPVRSGGTVNGDPDSYKEPIGVH